MATYERLDYGSSDGSRWGGASSDALGMYGATPTVRLNIGLGLSTATHASTLVSSIAEALKTFGMFSGT